MKLSALLADAGSDGVYRAPATEVATIEAVAEAAGWRLVHIDTAGATDKAAVLAALKEAFGFPDWFGANLDALVDCLREVDTEPGTLLLWDHPDGFAAAEADQYRLLLDVLRSRSAAAHDPTTQPARLLTLLRAT